MLGYELLWPKKYRKLKNYDILYRTSLRFLSLLLQKRTIWCARVRSPFLCMIYLISVMYVWVFCQYFLRLRDFLLSYGSKKFNCENLSKRKNYMACITKAHKSGIDYRETWVKIRSSVGSISVSYLLN